MKLCKEGSYFKCQSGDRCISSSLKCDNIADCPDASDESDTMCDGEDLQRTPSKPCNLEKEFECEAKICIKKFLVCDGIPHCLDGRDEDAKMCSSMNVSSLKNLSDKFD